MIDARHAAQQFRSAFSECLRRAPSHEKADEIAQLFLSAMEDTYELIASKRGWAPGDEGFGRGVWRGKASTKTKKKAASKKAGGASDDGDS